MNKVIAIEGVTTENTTDLLRILAVVGLKRRGGLISDLVPLVNDSYDGALTVLKALDADVDTFTNLCKKIKNPDLTEENALSFVKDFRAVLRSARFKHDAKSISREQSTILANLLTLFSTPTSDSAFTGIQKNIKELQSTDLTKAYSVHTADELGSVEDLVDAVKNIAKELTGKSVLKLTTEQSAKAKNNDPEGLKEFTKAKNLLKLRVAAEIRNIVRELGEDNATTKAVFQELAARNVPNPMHPGFGKTNLVFVNELGNITDKFGNEASSTGSSPDYNVEVNKDYDPNVRGKTWIFRFVDPADDNRVISNGYAIEKTRERKAADFAKISNALEHLDSYKATWRRHLMSRDGIEDPDKVYGAFAELLYWTGLRPSTSENAGSHGKPTFGASSFQVRHVKVLTGDENKPKTVTKMQFKFLTKSAQTHTFIMDVNSPDIPDDEHKYYKALVQLIAVKRLDKDGTDIVLTVNNKRMIINNFNKWVKSKGIPFTSKNFRTFRGTQVAMEELPKAMEIYNKRLKANKGKPLAEKDVNDIFYAAMLKVGEKLGHKRNDEPTHSTAIKSYVDPSIMVQWYADVGYQMPSDVALAAKNINK